MTYKKSVLKILSANSECFRVSAGIAPNSRFAGRGHFARVIGKDQLSNINSTMRYLVTCSFFPPFFTKWFNPENFEPNSYMTVFDLLLSKYTTDGVTWQEIETDHL